MQKKPQSRRYLGPDRFSAALYYSRDRAKRSGYMECLATKEELTAAFTGHCAVCGVPESDCKGKLHLDHDHITGDFRGFLCPQCNRVAGLLKDSSDLAFELAIYLEKEK